MIIKRAPKLILKVLEGNAFPEGTHVEISPHGIIGTNS